MKRSIVLAGFAMLLAAVLAGGSAVTADQNEGSTSALVDAQRLISVGGLHTCAVMDNGVIRCWGANDNGQLGNSTRAVTTIPIPVDGINNGVAVSAGNTHTCALLKDATVKCWGLNGNGQVGADPVLVNSNDVPLALPGLDHVLEIAAGGFHNCGLLDTGGIKCWGLDGAGQLGDGNAEASELGTSYAPVDVVGINNAVAVAAGEFHTCALLTTGGVKCWGHNGFGQLGNGNTTDTTSPVSVSGLPDGTKKAKAISAGYGHTCVVLDDDDPGVNEDTVRCWGNNNQGQLGDGTRTDRNTPVKVQVDVDPSIFAYDYEDFKGATTISLGKFHSCSRTHSGGARCWGNASRGQIGNGTIGDPNPFLVNQPESQMWRSATSASIGGVTVLAAGGFHTCALTGAAMSCWGYNFYGQLGSYQSFSHVPISVTSLQSAESVATGTNHACARVLKPGTPDTFQPVCWGTNANGELGANLDPGTTGTSRIPINVHGLTDVSILTAGNGHVCTLPSGSASPKCWGRNGDGQLGNGGNTNSNAPVAVSGLTTVTQISAKGARDAGNNERGLTCARLSDATARCWGRNDNGQVGDGTNSDRNTPATVKYDDDADGGTPPVALPNVTAVAAGGRHACALRSDTGTKCWGFNGFGQLGRGNFNSSNLALDVLYDHDNDPTTDPVVLTGVAAITAGWDHTCALMGPGSGSENGRVRCWGYNGSGGLGDGTTSTRTLPTLVPTIPQPGPGNARNDLAVALTGGDDHTCAILANASARCWGLNDEGQLGDGTTTNRPNPVTPVSLDNDTADTIRNNISPPDPRDLVTSLSAGRNNTCASLIDTTVSCWGSNSHGQLGDGVGPTRRTPIAVLNLTEGVGGNKSPSAVDDAFAIAEDTPTSFAVTANDSDPDGDALNVLMILTSPSNGTAVPSGGNVDYTPNANFCGNDNFKYRIFDGRNGVADAVVSITISCVNDPPVAGADSITTNNDTAVIFDAAANDTDADGDSLTVISVTAPANGTATIHAPTNIEYEPNPGYFGPDSFTYTISDGNGGTAVGNVDVMVNRPPTANDDAAATDEDTPVNILVLANDTDPDVDGLTVISVTTPAKGSAAIEPGGQSVTYTPEVGFPGVFNFDYTISDGRGGTAVATVAVTVSDVEHAPQANDDAANTDEDTPVNIPVLANDIDLDSDDLAVTSISPAPARGTATIAPDGKSITYTPQIGFPGVFSFGYIVDDGTGGTDSATVDVTVSHVNHNPSASDDNAVTDEDNSVGIDILANDFDVDGDDLTITGFTVPARGSVTLAPDAKSLTYMPEIGFPGVFSFDYTVSDAFGGSDTATVNVNVGHVNHAPVANGDTDSTNQNVSKVIDVLANDTDVDGDGLTIVSASTPTHGTAVVEAGKIRYTPNLASFCGADSFTYEITDGSLGSSAVVNMTVSCSNNAPTLDPIGNQTSRWGVEVSVDANGNDPDGDLLTYSISNGPGSIDSSTGLFTWTPNSSEIGIHSITIRVTDNPYGAFAERTFSVNVTKASTILTYSGATSGEYSDFAPVSAHLTDNFGTNLAGKSLTFKIGNFTVVGTTGPDGTATASLGPLPTPGSTSVSVQFTSTNDYLDSDDTEPFTINKEKIVLSFTGQYLTTASGSSSPVVMSANAIEDQDGNIGTQLGGMQVAFTPVSGGGSLCVASVTLTGSGTGTATCTTSPQNIGANAFIVQAFSDYYAGPVDVSVFTVAQTPSRSAAGGGKVNHGADRDDFGFQVLAGTGKTPPTGNMIHVYRAGTVAYVLRSNSLSSYGTSCSGNKASKVCTATLQGSALTTTVNLLTGTAASQIGTSSIRVDASDAATPPDRYSVDIGGLVPYSLGTPTSQLPISAGEVKVL